MNILSIHLHPSTLEGSLNCGCKLCAIKISINALACKLFCARQHLRSVRRSRITLKSFKFTDNIIHGLLYNKNE